MAEQEPEREVAWTAVVAHIPVEASDGTQVGTVLEVAALPEEDIFHGIVFSSSALRSNHLAPAADVARITDRAVYLTVDKDTAAAYPEFREEHMQHLGVTGRFFWKHLGWKKSSE